jgi:hypothetical protein
VVRVDGQVGRPRFQDAEHGDDHVDPSRHRQADHLTGLHASRDQAARQRVGQAVEFLVGQALVAELDRGPRGQRPCPTPQDLVQPNPESGCGIRDG